MDSISRYMQYIKEYPTRFRNNELLSIILDESKIREVSKQLNKPVGVVFENEFITVVVDLIQSQEGKYYTYARILNKNTYNGVVIIPRLGEKIVFLNQFRHATRNDEIELPRGFSEIKLSKEDNVKAEVFEELGTKAYIIECLGSIVSDSSLIGGIIYVFTCEVDYIGELETNEGIKNVTLLTWEEIEAYISGNKIRDSFSISALYKYYLNINNPRRGE